MTTQRVRDVCALIDELDDIEFAAIRDLLMYRTTSTPLQDHHVYNALVANGMDHGEALRLTDQITGRSPIAPRGAHVPRKNGIGPDDCATCSDAAQAWVTWPCEHAPAPDDHGPGCDGSLNCTCDVDGWCVVCDEAKNR